MALYKHFCDTYPIALLEDPFAEEDFEGHAQLTAIVGDKALNSFRNFFHLTLRSFPQRLLLALHCLVDLKL